MHSASGILGIGGGQGNDGEPCDADGRGVAKDSGAGLGVVSTGYQGRHGGAGEEQVVEGLKESMRGCAEGDELVSRMRKVSWRERGAPGEAFGDSGLEVMVEAAMNGGSFAGLDGCIDGHGLGPGGGIELPDCGATLLEMVLPALECGGDVRVAIVKKGGIGDSDAEGMGRGGCCKWEVKEAVAEEWTVCEIAIEPTDSVEGGGEVVAAGPKCGCVQGNRGAIAGEAAEGGWGADGTSSISGDCGEGGALLYAGRGAAGRATGESTGVERL